MTKKILISEIELNRARQPRVGMNSDYVAELHSALENGVTLPPIKVYSERGGSPYFLSDGWHRLEANLAIGFREIDAEVFTGTAFDAFKNSLGENDAHGLRRTNADKQRAVRLAFEEPQFKEFSDRAIAEICKVTHPFVAKVRPVVTVTTSEAQPKKRIGRDGKSQSATKSKDAKSGPKKQAEQKPKKQPEVFDSNGFAVPSELVNSWNDIQATVTDLQMHAHVLLDKWPAKMFGEMSQRTKDALNVLLKALDVMLCPECKGAKCKACHKTGIVSKRPLQGVGK